MTFEQFTNFGSTTLNGSINNSVTSITVTSASSFPTSSPYRIVIESEIMLVTAGAGTTTWTVTRGYESTTAASHADQTRVVLSLTVGNLSQLTQDRVLCPVVPIVQTTPDVSAFSWINQQTGATFDQTNGFLHFQSPSMSTAQSVNAKAIPTAPYTITIKAAISMPPSGTSVAGFVLIDNSSNGMICYWEYNSQATIFKIDKYNALNTNSISFQGNLFSATKFNSSPTNLFDLQIVDDNSGSSTARSFNMNLDGFHWETLYSSSRTSFITATKVGFYAQSVNAWAARTSALSWIETSP